MGDAIWPPRAGLNRRLRLDQAICCSVGPCASIGSSHVANGGLLIPRSQVRSLSGPLRASVDAVRIDKWLWAARFFKTRGLAARAVLTGRVEVNGERVKPSRLVRAGEMVAVTKGTEHWTVAVTGVTDRRGPAAVAQTLYSETAESRADREQRVLERRARTPGDDLGARPTKRARRRLDALRRGRRTR
jgi:ribosome-associated heat shock protein Hsp15